MYQTTDGATMSDIDQTDENDRGSGISGYFKDKTSDIECIKKAFNSPSNDDAIRDAISSTAFIIRLMENGDRVMVEEKYGGKRPLIIR